MRLLLGFSFLAACHSLKHGASGPIRPISNFDPWSANPDTSVFDNKLLMLHIGKTGGTTINVKLKGTLNTARVEMLDHLSSHLVMRDCFRHPSQQYAFFVRSPIHRFVSGWISRFLEGRPAFYSPWSPEEQLAFSMFPTPDDLACSLSSSDEARRDNATWAMQNMQHLTGDLRFYVNGTENLQACDDNIAFVGRVEHFEEDYGRLVRLFHDWGLWKRTPPSPQEMSADRRHVAPAEASSKYKRLGRCAVEALRKWYSEDYSIIQMLANHGHISASYVEEVEQLDRPPAEGQTRFYGTDAPQRAQSVSLAAVASWWTSLLSV